jgi:hypothetical protein
VTTPHEPPSVSMHDLTVIKSALADRANGFRHASAAPVHEHEGSPAEARAVLRKAADECTALAARLSFAVPGQPIEVVA